MSKRDTILLLEDMLQSAKRIKKYTESIDFDMFMLDEKTKDAVARNFEVIAEATNRIDQDFTRHASQIKVKQHTPSCYKSFTA